MPGVDGTLAALLAALPDGDTTPTNGADSLAAQSKTFSVQLPNTHIPLRLASAPAPGTAMLHASLHHTSQAPPATRTWRSRTSWHMACACLQPSGTSVHCWPRRRRWVLCVMQCA